MAKENDNPTIISIKKHERDEVRSIVAEIKAYDELVAKIKKYVERYKQKGGLPTLQAISKKFKITIDKAEDIAESEDSLELITGVRMNGSVYEFKTKGECQIDLAEDQNTDFSND